MWQQLCDRLRAAAGKQILVIGDYMLDQYIYGDAERISPEAPVPVLRVVRTESALGGAGSVAADICALEAVPLCVGIMGDDAIADEMQQHLQEAGARTDGLVRVPDRPTTRKSRLIGMAQHRHRQQLIRIDAEDRSAPPEATVKAMVRHALDALPTCHAVCFEDYAKGVIQSALTQPIIAAARTRGLPILVDPAGTSQVDYAPYAGATVATPNRTETERLIGRRLPNVNAVRQAAADILSASGTENVCVTLDAEGAALIGPGGAFEHVPTKVRDVYDVTGAGDEVLAAMAVALAAGSPLIEAVHLANVAGGLEVEKFGCVPILLDEIIGEILLEHHRQLGKIRTLDQLAPELTRRRSRGETIAFTNGCFDIVHAGHVSNLAFARRHADMLVVGLNSDASVRRQGKGDDRPINNEQNRATVLAALADVDYVVVFDDDTPLRLIEALQPDVLVKGQDWKDKRVVGQDVVESRGGKVILAPLVEGLSTTDILARIRRD